MAESRGRGQPRRGGRDAAKIGGLGGRGSWGGGGKRRALRRCKGLRGSASTATIGVLPSAGRAAAGPGRREPLCSCHGPLMNHCPGTWPPSLREEEGEGPARKQQASLQFKDNMSFTGTVPSSSPFWFKGQNRHLR